MLKAFKRLLPVNKEMWLLLILIYILTVQVLPVNATISSWVTKKPMPTPRGQSVVITGDDGLIYVIGGVNSDGANALATVEAYDHVADSWVTRSPLPKATIGAAGAKGLDGTIYVISGSGPGRESMQAYNPASDTWTEKAPIPTPIWGGGAAAGEDGRIYIIGGLGGTGLLQVYDPATDTWSNGSSTLTPRLELGVIRGEDGLIYAIGGYSLDEQKALSTVEAYDPATNTCYTKAPIPAPLCQFATTLGPLGKIYVIGGSVSFANNSAPYNTAYSYNSSTDTWEDEEPLVEARRRLGGAAVANKIFAIGGVNGGAKYLDTNEAAIIPDTVKPVVDAGLDIEAGQGVPVVFDGSNSKDDIGIVNYTWTFMDAAPQNLTGVNPTYTFETVGKYNIMLNVTDWGGNWATDNVMVTVNDTEVPIADAYCDGFRILHSPIETYRVEPGTAITFDASGSSDNVRIVHYLWDFGDGIMGTGITKSYTYIRAAEYIVTLTVRDSADNTGVDRIKIIVKEKAGSEISCSVTPSNISIGDSISVSGSLSPSVGDVNITLIYTTPQLEVFNREATLSVDSTFNDTFRPFSVGSWSVKAYWEGGATVKGSTSSEVAFTVSKASSSISCSSSTSTVKEGDSVTVLGTTTPPIPDAIVTLMYAGPEGTVLNRTLLTNADGAYSDKIFPSEKGLWRVKALREGDVTMEGAISNEVSFTVVGPLRIPLETLISSIVIILALTGLYFIKPKNGS